MRRFILITEVCCEDRFIEEFLEHARTDIAGEPDVGKEATVHVKAVIDGDTGEKIC